MFRRRAVGVAAPRWSRPGAVLVDSARVMLTNGRLRQIVATWGLWVVGDWALLVLLSVTAYDRGGTAAVAVVGALRMIPGALVGPVLSLVADRISRVQVLGAALVTWSVLVGVVPIVLRAGSLLPLYGVVIATSITGTLLRPAINALIPQVIDRPDELTVANSSYSITEASGSLIGPLLAGLLVATVATTTRYLVVAVVFGLAAAISATIRTDHKPSEREIHAGWRRLGEPLAGFPALLAPPRLRSVFVVMMAQTTTRGLLNVLVVAFAVSLPGMSLASTGLFFAALGAGGVIGGAVTMLGRGWRPGPPFVIGMSMWGLPLVVVAAFPTSAVALSSLAVIGIGNAIGDVYGFTLVHRLVPDHLLGRAFGAFWGTAAATQAFGAALAVPLISGLGLQTTTLVVGIVMAAAALLSWLSIAKVEADLVVDAHVVDALCRCTLLAPLTRVALEQLTRRTTSLDVARDTVVIAQGDLGDSFFVIDSGELEAQVDGVAVRALGPGDCFGEIAALQHRPRTATVVTRQRSRLLKLGGSDFVYGVTGHRSAERAALTLARERIEHRAPALSPGVEEGR